MVRTRVRRLVGPLGLAIAAALVLAAPSADANPLGGEVKAGAATIAGEGTGTVTISQSSNRAVIDWRTFNIGAGEATRFSVPNASSITLNRVTGGLGPSTIYGHLSSNGQLVLINPNGILFGAGSVVDAAGLVATSHDIANADFMAGSMVFDRPGNPSASVVNAGTITVADRGFAALVAPGVRNEGVITANLGRVALAAGNGFTLDLYGDGLINLKVGDEIAAEVRDVRSGQPLSSLVSNAGTIKADGGRVALTAATARRVVDSVVNNSGVIEANAVAQRGGTIILGGATAATKTKGAPAQTVKVSGTLKAAGSGAGQKGGKIQITGEAIRVADARLDASGKAGGGTVLVGGDVRGGKTGPAIAHAKATAEGAAVPAASSVVIEPSVTIDVSATETGNAGKAIVWSGGFTSFKGTVLATGAARGGDGGFVEVSSAGKLIADGRISVAAPAGTPGLVLFDPEYAYVVAPGHECLVYVCDETASYISTETLESLSGATYIVWANREVHFDASFAADGTVFAWAPSITVDSPFSANSIWFHIISPDAYGMEGAGIHLNAAITASSDIHFNYSGSTADTWHYASLFDTSKVKAPGFELFVPGKLVMDGEDGDPLPGVKQARFIADSIIIPAGRQLVKAISPGAELYDGWFGAEFGTMLAFQASTALSVGSGARVQADTVGLGLSVSGLSFAMNGTLRGRDIWIERSWMPYLGEGDCTSDCSRRYEPEASPLDFVVGGRIELARSLHSPSFLSIENGSGDVHFTGTIVPDDATTITAINMAATGDLTILNDLRVQGGMALTAGGTLTLPGRVTIADVVFPPESAEFSWGGTDFDPNLLSNRAGFLAVGATFRGPGGSAAAIVRENPDVGGIAIVRDDGDGSPVAYLDGFTATEVEAIIGSRGYRTLSAAVVTDQAANVSISPSGDDVDLSYYVPFGLSGPIASTSSLTPADLAPRITVPARLGTTAPAAPDTPGTSPQTPVTTPPPAEATTNPLAQITTTPPIDMASLAPSDTLVVDQTGGFDQGGQGSGQAGQGSQGSQGQGGQGQGGQSGQSGNGGQGGQRGQGSIAGREALPPMPRTFDVPPPTETRFVADEVLLRLDAKLTPEQIAALEQQFGLTPLQRQTFGLGGFGFARYRIPGGQDLRAVIAALSGNQGVMVGQPNYTYSLSEDAAAQSSAPQVSAPPSQPPPPAAGAEPASAPARALPGGLQLQYAVEKLRLVEAHQRARGREVLVAVIDSQIDVTHPELKDALREVIDATGGGASAPHEHGTGMAGALAARSQLTGTAPASAIIGITAFRTDGKGTQGTTMSILNALDIAHRQGARIVNMSFAGPRDPLLARAIAEARHRGMILVAAAGNAGPKSPPLYPAADPNVIAVTAIDADDNAFSMANRGSYITVAAPGVDVLVPAPGNTYEFTSGTSVATAEISGLVALMLERDPSADVDDVKQALMASARDLGPVGPDPTFGAGAADAVAALQAMDFRTAATPPRPQPAPVAVSPKPARPVASTPGRARLTPASASPGR